MKKGALYERRRLWLDLEYADYIRETLNITDCKIVARVDRRLIAGNGTVVLDDKRYFIPSLDPDKVLALDILRHIRNHWRIETACTSEKTAGGTKIATTPKGRAFLK